MQPAALPAPDDLRTWDDLEQPNTRTAPAPVPRRQIIGLPAGHLKDASGAAARPGSAWSLTCPPARHGHGSYRETGDAVTHARATTTNQKTPAQVRLDTAPLLQG